jgi:OOP family OmpA-OmpF porin
MKKTAWGIAALAAGIWSTQAMAVNTDGYDIPYVGAFGSFTITDSGREWDNGPGFQLTFGMPTSWESYAFEISLYSARFKRDIDGNRDYHTGLNFDVVRDFGSLYGLKPFALAGLGVIQDDVQGSKDLRPAVNIGGGALYGLPWWGMGVRAEARAMSQYKSDSAPGDNFLFDYRLLLGLQVPLTPYFMPSDLDELPPVEDCPVAVVDPVTGRTDCVTDSDGDGVPDHLDECPGTPRGTRVDSRGCPVSAAGRDSDGDGVPDDADACPDTMPGVTVNAFGCAEPQPLVISDFTFEFDSAQLTSAGRRYLDKMAAMLRGQPELTVEIIGHTDSLGAETYNQELSQARAESVLNYLADNGVEHARLTATGRGESQPVASNETDEGRARNRRVAFWLYVQ